MTIVFITSTMGYGGAAKMLSFVANILSESQNSIHVIAYSCVTPVPSFNKGIHLHLIGGALKGCSHIKILKALNKKLRDIKPDLIISFLTFPNLYSVLLGKYRQIPVIVSERGNPFVLKGFKMKVIYKIINHASGAVFQTGGAKSFFSKRLQKESVVIPNPVVKRNNEVEYNHECDNHEIVFIGRLENKQKRLDLLFEALGIVIKSYSDAKLIIYGDGEDEQNLKEMASEYECCNSIIFMGKTSDPEKAMSQSEVFVISSDYEGIPNSLIEAMSIGMPVVATDCDPGGARLLIQNEVNGFIVPKGDSKAIAEKVISLFSDKELRISFSNRAKEITNTYSESKIKGMWEDYIFSFQMPQCSNRQM